MDRDFILMQRIKSGRDDAVEEFVRKYYPVILKYCRYHTTDKDIAQDLTQETFEKFFASLSRYQHRGKAANYLYVIAGNLCRDSHRRHSEIPLEEREKLSEEYGNLPGRGFAASEEVNPMEAAEDRLLVEQALGHLPQELREVIILYYFQNLKLKEISQILQIGLPLVKYRMSRAKELLREYLAS